MDVGPRPTRTGAGQVITRTHQRLIDVAIDSLQEADYSGLPDLETDDDDQGNGNVVPQFEVQDDSMIEFMHNINIMIFPDEIIRTDKQTGQIVPLRNIVHCPIEPTVLPTVTQLESWAVSDDGASEAFNMYEANDIWMQHGSDLRVNTCRRMIWLRRVGMFLDYKSTHSKDSEIQNLNALNRSMFFLLQMLCMSNILFHQSRYMQPSRRLNNHRGATDHKPVQTM
jgi:hypothetical protein